MKSFNYLLAFVTYEKSFDYIILSAFHINLFFLSGYFRAHLFSLDAVLLSLCLYWCRFLVTYVAWNLLFFLNLMVWIINCPFEHCIVSIFFFWKSVLMCMLSVVFLYSLSLNLWYIFIPLPLCASHQVEFSDLLLCILIYSSSYSSIAIIILLNCI